MPYNCPGDHGNSKPARREFRLCRIGYYILLLSEHGFDIRTQGNRSNSPSEGQGGIQVQSGRRRVQGGGGKIPEVIERK